MNRKPNSKTKTATTKLLVVLLIAIVANFIIYFSLTSDHMPRDTVNLRTAPIIDNENTEEEEPPRIVIPEGYAAHELTQEEIHMGDLILVNNDHAYNWDAISAVIPKNQIVNIYENKTKNYALSNTSMELASITVENLNNMFGAYYAVNGKRDIYLNAALRTFEVQEEIFAEKGDAVATKPGYSEHHSGLAFDIAITTGGKYMAFTDEGHYVWIPQNCAKYGFVRRYPEGKTAITGITFEPWHFRYVGVPHAEYMYNNDIVLEEYIELLKQYTFLGEHLKVTSNGKNYEIYYIPSEGAITKVYYPENKNYSISGNNVDGFIVTVDLSEKTDEASQTAATE